MYIHDNHLYVLTTGENDDDSETCLAEIIVLVILFAISFIIIAYLIYQIRRLKVNTKYKNREKDNSKDVYEKPDKVDEDYEQVENKQSTYTALKT